MIFQVEADCGDYTAIITEDVFEALKKADECLSMQHSGVQLTVWDKGKTVHVSKVYNSQGEINIEEIYGICSFIKEYKENKDNSLIKYLVIYELVSGVSRIRNVAVISAVSEECAKNVLIENMKIDPEDYKRVHVYDLRTIDKNWFFFTQ